MMGGIEAYLVQNWDRLGLKPPVKHGLHWAVINGGTSVRSKLVCPVWKDGAAMPCLIVKLARYPRYNVRLETEYSALEQLQHYLPPGPERAPRPVDCFEMSGLTVSVETALPARPLRAYLREHPADYPEELERLEEFADWMARLHARSARTARFDDLTRHVREPLQAADEELDLSESEQAGLSAIRVQAESLAAEEPLPIVFNHNDPGSTNVMADRRGRFAGLIDWESGSLGLPAVDLCYFLARFAYETRAAGGPDQLKGYRELFFYPARQDPGAFAPDLAARWLAGYCSSTALSPRWLPVLFGLGWIMHSRNERDQLLGLRAEGQLLHGKPATVTAATADRRTIEAGHFRSQLRFYLENLDAFVMRNA